MPNQKEQFNVGDTCIILLNEVPTQSVITRKVSNDELAADGKAITSVVRYYVSHQGNSEPWTGKIFKDKISMMNELGSFLK